MRGTGEEVAKSKQELILRTADTKLQPSVGRGARASPGKGDVSLLFVTVVRSVPRRPSVCKYVFVGL